MTYSVSSQWKYTYGGILIASQLFALIIPLLYWSSRKCRHHPASIILILCLLEMVSTYQLYFQTICLKDVLEFFKLYQLIQIYTLSTFEDKNSILRTMCWWNQSVYFLCIYAQINYYIVLCSDLIITLKKPFYNSSKRNPIYHGVATIVFSLVRMCEPYFFFRLKFFFLKALGKVSIFQIQEVFQFEQKEDQIDQWVIPLGQLVTQLQNQQTVNHILCSLLEITTYQNEIQSFRYNSLNLLKSLSRRKVKKELIKNASMYPRVEVQNRDSITIFDKLVQEDSKVIQICYTVTEYAPEIFQYLRELDNIGAEKFKKSLDLKLNSKQIEKAQESLGNSGSFFFFTYDKRMILKTMSESELNLLLKKVLPNFVHHVRDNPQTLICHIYGAYTLDIQGLSAIHLILMENTVGELNTAGLRLYDLKGSLVNRFVRVKSQNQIQNDIRQSVFPIHLSLYQKKEENEQIQVLKDVNYIESNDIFLQIERSVREELFEQIKKDTDFFTKMNIMDYSLLLGVNDNVIYDQARITRTESSKSFQLPFRKIQCGDKIVSMSIIDVLQQYNFWKILEFKYKATFSNQDPNLLSCVDSEIYRQRFIGFMNSLLISVISE